MKTRLTTRFSSSRRTVLKVLAAAGTLLAAPPLAARLAATGTIIKRRIPKSSQGVPVIGLGTSGAFDVGSSAGERADLRTVLKDFVRLGGRVVDTSPTYGNAEAVVGDLARELGVTSKLFFATKVDTVGRESGIEQMRGSFKRLHTDKIELMQVHNLVDTETQLKTMRAWKRRNRFGYIGITHYRTYSFPDLEHLLKTVDLDFVQFNYSIGEREAEKHLLPLAAERNVAVLINRPFQDGSLFSLVKNQTLPTWASKFDCESWAQFFLKYIISHPAVTAVIPATSNPKHLRDNMRAGYGRLPDNRLRQRMVNYIEQL